MSWQRISNFIPLCIFYKFDTMQYMYVIPQEDYDVYDRVMNMFARDMYGSEQVLDDPETRVDVLNHARPTLQNVFYQKAKESYKKWQNSQSTE